MLQVSPPELRPSARSSSLISAKTFRLAILLITAFILGLVICSGFFLYHIHANYDMPNDGMNNAPLISKAFSTSKNDISSSVALITSSSLLDGLRILVTIVSFDFMQLIHLEEVLDGLFDLCYTGANVDIVVYTTVVVSFCVVPVRCWIVSPMLANY